MTAIKRKLVSKNLQLMKRPRKNPKVAITLSKNKCHHFSPQINRLFILTRLDSYLIFWGLNTKLWFIKRQCIRNAAYFFDLILTMPWAKLSVKYQHVVFSLYIVLICRHLAWFLINSSKFVPMDRTIRLKLLCKLLLFDFSWWNKEVASQP